MFGINPLGTFIQSIIALFVFKYSLKIFKLLFWVFLYTMFLYSAGPTDTEMNKMSYWKQVGFRGIHEARHNLRLLSAKVIPLKPSYFYNVSEDEAKEFPSKNESFIKESMLAESQKDYLSRGKFAYKEFSGLISGLYHELTREKEKLREVAQEIN